MNILDIITLVMLVVFPLVYFIERRTMWIGVLFLLWVGSIGIYGIFMLESIDQPIAIGIFAALALVLVLGFPFYLLSFIWLLISSGIRLIKREGKRLRNFLSLSFGLFLIGWLIYSLFLNVSIEDAPFFFFITSSISISVYYFFFLLAIFAISSVLNRYPMPFKRYDYIIVLGSGLIGDKVPPLLANRIDKGLQYYHRGQKKGHRVKVIFTGGQGADELLPEGVAMANYAKEQGLDDADIIIEDQAKNTYENLLFSKALMTQDRQENQLPSSYKVLTVTNNFHVFRALLWARKVGVKCDGAGARTKFYFWLNALIREFIGVVFMQKKFHIALLISFYVFIAAFVLLNQWLLINNFM